MMDAPQFSVHRGPTGRPPLVIVVQANDFARLPTRVVAPLLPASAMPDFGPEHPRVAPMFSIRSRRYVLNPLGLATIGVHRLGASVASLADDDDARRKIQDALDVALKPY